ncbi:MAG: glycosyltransferase family 2 protein [Pirellulaceae bacterium]
MTHDNSLTTASDRDASATPERLGPRDAKYSVVIPVYRSAPMLPTLIERLEQFFLHHRLKYEIVLVNDGSPDNSWEVLEQLNRQHQNLVIVDLLRNYGQHSAVFCGLQTATGDFVITMDDDLQNPPEEMSALIRKADEGHDVVFGKFHQKIHSPVRRAGSKLIGWLNYKLFNKPRELTLTNYRIIRREVVDAVCSFHTTFPYIPGLLLMCGKTFANAPVAHHARAVGDSNYNWRVIARLVWRIVFNYSAFPLRLLCTIGGITAAGSFVLGMYYLIRSFFVASATPGWPTLVVMLSFYHGITLMILAAVSEYLVRVVNDVSGRKAYRIRKKL